MGAKCQNLELCMECSNEQPQECMRCAGLESDNFFCLTPINEQESKVCIEGESLISDNLKQCSDCNDDNQFIKTISRCTFKDDGQQNQIVSEILACKNGFVKDGVCVLNCGTGYYGKSLFDERGLIKQSFCLKCSDDCFECIDLGKCTSCQKGFYLQTEVNKTFGSCFPKIQQYFETTIYVDPFFSFAIPSNDNTGVYNNPFRDIQTALTKGYELGAKFLQSKIFIILKASENKHHAMLRQYLDFNLSTTYDQYQMQNCEIASFGSFINFDTSPISALKGPQTLIIQVQQLISQSNSNLSLSGCAQFQTDSDLPCFSIDITNSTFKSIGSMKKSLNSIFINSTTQQQHYGSILDLEDFRGDIKIRASNFTKNQVKYQGCVAAKQIYENLNPQVTDQYPSLGNKTEVKIHSLISITNHSYNVELIGNIFGENSGTKGIIDLDINKKNDNKILIALNQFKLNFGFSESTVLYINHRVEQLNHLELVMENQNQEGFCSGFHLIKNNFEQNLGCPLYSGGLISYQCLEKNQPPLKVNDTYSLNMPTINLDEIEFDWVEKLHKTQVYQDNLLEYDLNMNSLQSNIYQGNYGTGGKGLISIYGSLRLILNGEILIKNGESCDEILNSDQFRVIFGTYFSDYLSFVNAMNQFIDYQNKFEKNRFSNYKSLGSCT
ncbi:UNKNOWN [Stylonychia lemnae]|uniref:Uncharacterized protein n=1 Tax=Stylonychia lemnae TaxID=5949 RepID=A0A078A1K7_STYLE|nr:UNKNOWN [Stylonychia lemnae]|eukprot:CDW75732.1 UNKNOWN [Stylonychia lemnae]